MGNRNGVIVRGKARGTLKTFLKLEALFVPLYFSFVMYYTFLNAYFTPSEFNTRFINSFGEADFEFVLIPSCLILAVAGVIIWLADEMRKTQTVNNGNLNGHIESDN
ncbi:MAG: hypothetical protein SVK08_10200 [Halobacteriota archaeon]|nr:hypothetical protein [Halobacteriota archaeon]